MSSKVKISYNSEGSSDSEESINLDTMSPDKSSEEVREGDDGDIETSDEEFDSSDDSSSEKDGDKNSGLANVLSKLLAKQVNDKRVILAKGKTEKEILAARLRKEDSDGSDEDSKNNGQLDDEYALKRARQLKKKKWENMGRIKPKVLDRERERKLQRVATRGVVQLFNAVQKQQKTIKDKLNAVGSSVRKQDKVLQAVKKGDFIDALKKSDIQSEAISKNSTNDAEDMDKPSWSILKDDFMMGAKMKDWDKETDSEGEQAMEQGGDYSDSE